MYIRLFEAKLNESKGKFVILIGLSVLTKLNAREKLHYELRNTNVVTVYHIPGN